LSRIAFRKLFAVGAVGLGVAAFAAAACGIDVLGTGDFSEAGAPDASSNEAAFPEPCATLDASCLGALPPIWKPISVGAPGCAADFMPATLVANPRAPGGACACGACQPSGAFTCTGNTAISGGTDCKDDPIAQAAPGACTNASAQHLQATPPHATGTTSCFAANDAGTGATTDALTLCVPGCAADFCGSSSRCIVAEGDQACPSGFQLRDHAGTSADPGCPPCECEAGAPTTCGGTVTAYDDKDCADSGTITIYPVATCNMFSSGNYDSVRVKLVPPDASCSPVVSAAPIVGDASLVAVKTVCCQ
jgi:hypothetical protein